jgi:hypothetical protein
VILLSKSDSVRLANFFFRRPLVSGICSGMLTFILSFFVLILALRNLVTFDEYDDPHGITAAFYVLLVFCGTVGIGILSGLSVWNFLRRGRLKPHESEI